MTHLVSVVLTLNAGSSSLKFAAFQLADRDELKPLAAGQIEGLGTTAKGEVETAAGEKTDIAFNPSDSPVDHRAAMRAILGWLDKAGHAGSVAAVGHRVVHGGPDLVDPAGWSTTQSSPRLRALIPLAPLHEPHKHCRPSEAAMKAFPTTPQIACFDTAFHRSHPFSG